MAVASEVCLVAIQQREERASKPEKHVPHNLKNRRLAVKFKPFKLDWREALA